MRVGEGRGETSGKLAVSLSFDLGIWNYRSCNL